MVQTLEQSCSQVPPAMSVSVPAAMCSTRCVPPAAWSSLMSPQCWLGSLVPQMWPAQGEQLSAWTSSVQTPLAASCHNCLLMAETGGHSCWSVGHSCWSVGGHRCWSHCWVVGHSCWSVCHSCWSLVTIVGQLVSCWSVVSQFITVGQLVIVVGHSCWSVGHGWSQLLVSWSSVGHGWSQLVIVVGHSCWSVCHSWSQLLVSWCSQLVMISI